MDSLIKMSNHFRSFFLHTSIPLPGFNHRLVREGQVGVAGTLRGRVVLPTSPG